jgi:lipocalin
VSGAVGAGGFIGMLRVHLHVVKVDVADRWALIGNPARRLAWVC